MEKIKDNEKMQKITLDEKQLFHIHTFRCGHAEKVSDEAYVTRALELGATDLWFSDHAPFPGDPFRSRMQYSHLQEYIDTLCTLKQKYANRVNIHIGLEIEFFPSFDAIGYYQELKADRKIDFLLLGQHMAELSPSCYSFSMDRKWRDENEYKVLGNAIIAGIKSGYFDFRVVHGLDAHSVAELKFVN